MSHLQVIISIFAENALQFKGFASNHGAKCENANKTTLVFNLYCPKSSESADVYLTDTMQKLMTGEIIDVLILYSQLSNVLRNCLNDRQEH